LNHKDFDFEPSAWKGVNYTEECKDAKRRLQRVSTLYFPDTKYEWVLKTDGVRRCISPAHAYGRPHQ